MFLCSVIRQSTIDQIFSAASIEEVVGDYVQLKKSGSGLAGLCPFHNEKTPSFRVSPTLGIYKCFGCGKGGNVVDFVMEMDKLSYPEALRQLASKYHIEIEEDNTNREELSDQVKLRDAMYLAMDYATRLFNDNLMNSEEGRNIGYSYFMQRGITHQTMEEFSLGYAMSGWDHFLNTATKSGYDSDILTKTGLIKQRGDDVSAGFYDAYRERVMFPIRNLSGKVVGLGGRQLKKEEKSPKYVNSPENEIYHKSSVLYGLYESRKEIRSLDRALLVEGYLDVLMLFQSGLKNVVATSGTALTADQVKLIKRFTDNVTLLYDGDSAGIKAALRGVDLLLEGGLNVKVVVFPEGEDPDSWCRKVGGERMESYIKESEQDFVLFKTELLLSEKGRDPVGLSETAREVVSSIVRISDPIKRNAYLRQCATLLNFDEDLMMAEAKRQRNIQFQEAGKRTKAVENPQITFLRPELEVDPEKEEEFKNKEKALFQTMILYGEQPYSEEVDVAGYVISELDRDQYQFENPELGEVYVEAKEYYDFHSKLDEVFFTRHRLLGKLTADLLSVKYHLSPHWLDPNEIFVKTDKENYREELIANLNYLKLYKVEKFRHRLLDELKVAETDEDIIIIQQKIHQINEIRKQITQLLGIEGALPK